MLGVTFEVGRKCKMLGSKILALSRECGYSVSLVAGTLREHQENILK